MDAATLYALFFTPSGLAVVSLAVFSTLAGVLIARSVSLPANTFSRPRNRRG